MPTQVVPALTPLPAPPNPGAPSTFAALAYAFTIAQRDAFRPELAALGANVKFNADDAIVSATTATTKAADATTQAGLATTNGAAQVTLATTQAGNANTSAIAAAASAVSAVNAPGASGTSATSLTLGAATQTFTTQTGKTWVVGQPVSIARTSAPGASVMYGTITAYDAGTGAMSVLTGSFTGTGTFTDWTVALTGPVLPLKTINAQSLLGAGNIPIQAPPIVQKAFITATTTHTIPAGVTVARPYAVGAGAAGVASTSSGGGGGMAYGDIAVVAGDVLTINIAAGVATVIKGGVTMLTANPASGVTAGTASKNAAVTNGGNFSGGAGVTASASGGASSGSPLGIGVSAVAANGSGCGWGGTGAAGGGGGVGGAGTVSYGGAGLSIPSTDPLLFGLTGFGGAPNASGLSGGNGQPGGGGGAAGSTGTFGGAGGFGAGGGPGGANGGAGGFGAGGGAGTAGGAGGYGGGGASSTGGAGGAGGASAVLIFY